MLGHNKVKDFNFNPQLKGYAIKQPVFSFDKFPNVNKNLGPEMKSTGESILFIDNANKKGDIVLMDASKLGTTVKEGKNQKTLLSHEEEQKIINTFNKHEAIEDFTVVVSYEEIKDKNYSFSAGQYFEVKIQYTDITPAEFETKMNGFKSNLDSLFAESKSLEIEIQKQLNGLKYE